MNLFDIHAKLWLAALLTVFALQAPAAATLGQAATIAPGSREMIELSDAAGPSLPAALSGIAAWRISPGATVVVHLKDGVYPIANSIRIDHPDGARLHIVGNTADPGKVRLLWPAKMDAIQVGASAALGRLDGVTISRELPGGNDNGASDNANALVAEDAGVIHVGPHVVLEGFYYGAQARYGGIIRARGVIVRGAGDAGFFAYNGGHIDARESRAERTRDSKLKLGSGYVAEYGGTVDASNAVSEGNALAGFTALSGGAIVANDAKGIGNQSFGFYATTNGVIVAQRAAARSSGVSAVFTTQGGSITGLDGH